MNTKPPLVRIVFWLAGAGPLLFFAVALVEGWLRADYDPIARPISALALGPRGWVQQLNFALLTAAFFALAGVLRARLRPGKASVAVPGIFVLLTIGAALAGLFTMDAPGAAPTLEGRLHLLGGFLIFPWIPVVLLWAAWRFRRDPHWQAHFRSTLATGLFCLVTLVLFLLFVGPPDFPRPYPGLVGVVQRSMLLPFFLWIALVTRRIYASSNQAAAARHLPEASPAPAR